MEALNDFKELFREVMAIAEEYSLPIYRYAFTIKFQDFELGDIQISSYISNVHKKDLKVNEAGVEVEKIADRVIEFLKKNDWPVKTASLLILLPEKELDNILKNNPYQIDHSMIHFIKVIGEFQCQLDISKLVE